MNKELKVYLQIGRMSNEDQWRISVEDRLSGSRIVEVRMTGKQFADAIGSLYTECEATVCDGPVGKKREYKQINIKPPKKSSPVYWTERALQKLIVPFEVDGWKGDIKDFKNGHKRQEDGSYAISFTRYVDRTTGKPTAELYALMRKEPDENGLRYVSSAVSDPNILEPNKHEVLITISGDVLETPEKKEKKGT